jgi:hypothetical protein
MWRHRTIWAVGLALLVAAPAVLGPAHARTDSQTQTCPFPGGGDPDPVTLTGPATLWPPNHKLIGYTITASETPGEKGDGAPHGVTVSYNVTTFDPPGGGDGGPIHNPDAQPPSGMAMGDFSVSLPFQLRAERSGPGTGRTYVIDWTASFDGAGGVSTHMCSSMDGTHHAFQVTVPHDMGG